MNEMALGRMSANLLRIHSCMNIATHLRYRMLVLSENVNAEDRQFMTEYQQAYKFYLDQYQSPSGNASHVPVPQKKTRRGKRLGKKRGSNDSTSTPTVLSPSDVETNNSSLPLNSDSDQPESSVSSEHIVCDVDNTSSSILLSQSENSDESKNFGLQDQSLPMDVDESQDKISLCDYYDCKSYCSSCSSPSLNLPPMFHVSCIDLSIALEPYEPFSYRNEFGDHIEVSSLQKHLRQKRSQPETTSVDEMISMCSSACRPADTSFSTWNFVDWRELLSWASYTLFRLRT